MRRIAFDLFGFEIYSYGVAVMIGVLLALWVITRRARVVGIDPGLAIDATLYLLVGGLVGARTWYVLQYPHRVFPGAEGALDHVIHAINLRDGGLVLYGALTGGALTGIWFVWRHKIPLLASFDLGLSAVPIGIAAGRVGCFLNGCCWGKIVDSTHWPWSWIAIAYPRFEASGRDSIPYTDHLREGKIPEGGEFTWTVSSGDLQPGSLVDQGGYLPGDVLCWHTAPLIPSQLVSSLANLALFVFLAWAWRRTYDRARLADPTRRRPRQGEIALLTVIGYAFVRFVLELVRDDTPTVLLHGVGILGKDGLSIAQVTSLVAIILGGAAWALFFRGKIGKPIELPLMPEQVADPASARQGGTAEGGTAEGGTAEGGTAEGGTAEGGTAEGGTAEGGAPRK
jgi:phosphatidylglycerol:prolipoprotein diacylglycerol transferase